jgi:hypothetical protein
MAANGDENKGPINGQEVLDEKPVHEHGDTEIELSPQHREYLMQRHGTVDLDPIPAMDDADPYNWPVWKVFSPVHF